MLALCLEKLTLPGSFHLSSSWWQDWDHSQWSWKKMSCENTGVLLGQSMPILLIGASMIFHVIHLLPYVHSCAFILFASVCMLLIFLGKWFMIPKPSNVVSLQPGFWYFRVKVLLWVLDLRHTMDCRMVGRMKFAIFAILICHQKRT